MNGAEMVSELIPVVAILAVFAVPIVAIVMDYRKRALQSAERRAMIEKGMVPPDLADTYGYGKPRSAEALRARSLRTGTILIGLGLGLTVAAVLMINRVVMPFMPPGVLATGAAVVGFLGIANLVYYYLSKPRQGSDPPA